jgi:hypothetical protein
LRRFERFLGNVMGGLRSRYNSEKCRLPAGDDANSAKSKA